jgi:carboxylate-amine ligase
VLRAARWRAARYGLTEPIFDPSTAEYIEPRLAVTRLLLEVEPQLAKRHETEEVRALAHQLLERGTSAAQQRQQLHKGADTATLAGFLSSRTLAGCDTVITTDRAHAAPA